MKSSWFEALVCHLIMLPLVLAGIGATALIIWGLTEVFPT